jgi:WbqC-like protein family
MQWPRIICRGTDLHARTGRSERLADLTRAAGGSACLCGTGGSRYLDPSPFTAHGLTVEMFTPPQYQLRAGGSRVTTLTDLAITAPCRENSQLASVISVRATGGTDVG